MDHQLDPIYALLANKKVPEEYRSVAASSSPLALAMYADPSVRAFPHMRYLDAHVVALVNLQLYPEGPGPAPEVWGRAREGQGKWRLLGVGYEVGVSEEAFDCAELRMLRPDAALTYGGVDNVPSTDAVVFRLAISLPPRHGKSLLVTEYLPLWFLIRYPDNSVVVSTYNTTFAEKWGSSLQEKLKELSKRLPVASDGEPMEPLSSTMSYTKFRPGKDRGEINFRGFGGTLTGTGWGLGVIDDPFKDQEDAMSAQIRQAKRDWYTSTFSSRRTRRRGSPPPIEVMMFTRWHEEDLAGAFAYEEDGETSRPGWCVLRLAALAEVDDPLGREPGESLCPQLVPKSFLLAEQETSPTWFSALFQGRPTHQKGSMFAKTCPQEDGIETFWHYTVHGDPGARVFRQGKREAHEKDMIFFYTMDLATSEKTSADWTVVTLWGWDQKLQVLVAVDWVRDRIPTDGHRAWLKRFMDRTASYKYMFVGIENKTFGTALINELRAKAPSITVIPLEADKSKISRAMPYSEGVKAGNVWFPHPDTNPLSVAWENEHVLFPKGKHDDQVDTGSMAWTKAQSYLYAQQEDEEETVQEPTVVQRCLAQVARSQSSNHHPYSQLLEQMRRTQQ